jgi:hypothetical protein
MKIKNTYKTLAVIFALAVVAGSAQMASAATVIPLTNPSFEVDDMPANTGDILTPAGWTLFANGLSFVGDGGWLATGSPDGGGVAGAHSGDQYFLAHAVSGFTTIHQDTGLTWSALSAGDTLTVGAWTTYRSNVDGTAPTYFWLNDGDGSGLNSGAMDVTVGATVGVWTQRSWTYTVTQQKIDEALLGNWGAVNVQVGINTTGLQQVLFDDVSLVHTAIPEPSGIALCGLGLGLLALRRKRCL